MPFFGFFKKNKNQPFPTYSSETSHKLLDEKLTEPNQFVQTNVFCPICEKHHENFIDVAWNVTLRQDACPTCSSQTRHRNLWLFLQQRKPDFFSEPLTVLHWAPENFFKEKILKMSNIQYLRADLLPEDDDTRKLDMTHLDLPDNCIDIVICNHVFEHVCNDQQAMKETFRILKPGGCAFLTVPTYDDLEKTFEDPTIFKSKDRLKYFDQSDHVRKYAAHDFANRLRKAGFEVEYHPISSLTKKFRDTYGLNWAKGDTMGNAGRGADIFYCIKNNI